MLLHGKPRHATLFLSIFKKPKELGRRKHLALFFMSELRITLENFEKIRHVKHPSLNCLFLSDFRIWKREDIIFHFSSWICLFLLCLWSLPSAISFSNNVWNLLPFSPALPCQNSWSTARRQYWRQSWNKSKHLPKLFNARQLVMKNWPLELEPSKTYFRDM